ncbi:MAG: glycyl-radical enzyme activating protein, partial [Candidatus Scatosoma sp.]
SACPQNALGIYGEDITAEEAVKILTEDKAFFAEGGVTLSGGEPLMQKDFSVSVLRLLKKLGINTAVDTCLYAPQETLREIALYTDTFLADLKTIDGALHKRLTGRENGLILDNFRYLSQINAPVEVRIPFVPPLNDGELPAMARFLSGLNNIKAVKVLPYHRMYLQKHVALGHEFNDKDMRVPAKEELEKAKQTLRNAGLNVTEE